MKAWLQNNYVKELKSVLSVILVKFKKSLLKKPWQDFNLRTKLREIMPDRTDVIALRCVAISH